MTFVWISLLPSRDSYFMVSPNITCGTRTLRLIVTVNKTEVKEKYQLCSSAEGKWKFKDES